MKLVLSIGQCGPDTWSLRALLEKQFGARMKTADDGPSALTALRGEAFDLVLVNRLLDLDGSDGLEIIRQIKADPQLQGLPCMLVTNYPEYQQAAVAAGAEPGFGKQALGSPATRELLGRFLS